jgi:S1-C subfamily serine protease
MKRRPSVFSLFVCFLFAALTCPSFAQEERPFPQTLERVLPAIVKVFAETKAEVADLMMAEVLTDTARRLYSTGTGFFISNDGLIMTADHVIAIATGPIYVLVRENNDLNQLPATIVFRDSIADIAVLKAQKTGCPFLQLLDPGNLLVGVDVAFIGFPLDFYFPLVSKSVLSAKVDLPVKPGYPPRHQLVINQFVNHGNSGGPLFLASTGQVIGVVSWRPSPNVQDRLIVLPKNYQTAVKLEGVDPIRLAVETYNENLKYLGEVAQFGIGFVPSVEYAKQYIK